jgi:isopenicillin-N epimerase
MDRRDFFRAAAGAVALRPGAAAYLLSAPTSVHGKNAEAAARDEDFWFHVRHAFTVDRNVINLNNGGVSPAPRVVQDAERRYLEISNMTPVHFMWRILTPEVEAVRRNLAGEFGCDPEELAVTRNASEALETAQLGIDLKPGDEVLTTNQDYPRMITTWRQRERRDGIVLKTIQFPVPPPSLRDLYDRFDRAVTPRTRAIMVCHITNRTGQIFPVRDICRMARERRILTIVDGAHAFGQFPFRKDDLECDYYGTSLHKWLTAPIGTGFLYVRRPLIGQTWPLMAAPDWMREDIRKFEEIGTHPAAQRNAISEAITFHQSIGVERKAARLRYLRERWARRLEVFTGVRILTPYDAEQSCGIGFVSVEGMDPARLTQHLWDKHGIIVTPIVTEGEYQGLRVTPNVYTTLQEIDTFSDAMEKVLKSGLQG